MTHDDPADAGTELELDRLMQAYAAACLDHDAAAWQALHHPSTLRALSGARDLVLRYHRMEAFRRPLSVAGWRLLPLWEATESRDLLPFVPSPVWVARRVKPMPGGLEDAVSERMLAEHDGALRFVLRDFDPSAWDFLRGEMEKQENSWRRARSVASGLPARVREAIEETKPHLAWSRARRALAQHREIAFPDCLWVVRVVWADGPPLVGVAGRRLGPPGP